VNELALEAKIAESRMIICSGSVQDRMPSTPISVNRNRWFSRIRKMRAIFGTDLHVIENKKMLSHAYLAAGR